MPIYPYRCNVCERKWDNFHNIADMDNETCCGSKAIREIGVTARPVIMDYYDNGLGENVTGPKHRAELMKSKGCEAVG